MANFVYKLIPPRPTFAFDITEAERAIMEQHIAYWTELAERGIARVFGPVFDPDGVYGLGIVEVDGEEQVRQLAAGDPAVACGLRRAEFYPMQAVFGK